MSHKDQFSLDDKEYMKYIYFKELHKQCKPEVRLEMIEEDCAPTMSSIIMSDSSVGVNLTAKCHVCGMKTSLNSDERNEST